MAKLEKLITYAYLKEEVDIPANIDDGELYHKIYEAQETLRMLMGDRFYQDYVTNFTAKTLSANYTALLNYVKQYIAWQAHEFWVIKANFKPTRSGFRVHTEDNSVVATDVQMSTLIKDAKQKAQYYKTLLVDFMNSNYQNYELYDRSCGRNLTGNTFHVSAVSNNRGCSGLRNCRCRSCRW
jgi:hypothetical protein